MNVYNARGRSRPQRLFLSVSIAACVALAWWLLFGGGIDVLTHWAGHSFQPATRARRLLLAVALSIYWGRLLLTQFVFLKRAIHWREAVTVAVWVACIYVFLSLAGGTNSRLLGFAAAAGAALFLFGSWMNSWAEHQRHRWKRQMENHDHLYTAGLFRYCRHPNYLGDLISFSGVSLITGRMIAGVIPAIMLVGFVFVNIPMLDRHLAEHYGQEFTAYARRTRKLIPFVY